MLMRHGTSQVSSNATTNTTDSSSGAQSYQWSETAGGPPNRAVWVNGLPNRPLSSSADAARMRTAEKMGAASARAASNTQDFQSRLRRVGSGEVSGLLPRMRVMAPDMPPTEVIQAATFLFSSPAISGPRMTIAMKTTQAMIATAYQPPAR